MTAGTGRMAYRCLNALFHVLHIAIILFVMLGWLVPQWLMMHLVLTMLTLGSWFILGHWFGHGYCPVSSWHWRLKGALGDGRPEGTYIHLLLQRLSGRALQSAAVDRFVVVVTLLIAGISIALNVMPCLA